MKTKVTLTRNFSKIGMITVLMSTSMMGFSLPGSAQNVLDNYIRDGLKNNIVVQQKNIDLDKATNALREAKTLFLPAVNFNTTYTSGEGGRTIPLPIGDLMNPVYSTLNKLTQTKSFPQISNESINFFPVNFYDAKIRTTLPIYNEDLYHNIDIKNQGLRLEAYDVMAYKRALVKDIKTAYYNYLMAIAGTHIYQNAMALVDKNVEVNKSLLKNGKGVPASVLRAQSEAESIKNQLLEAQNNVVNAKHYFNFLLNRNLDEAIDTTYDETEAMKAASQYMNQSDIAGREELKMTMLNSGIYKSVYDMNKQFWVPRLSAFLDLGSQASDFAFNAQSKYYLVGAQLDIPIFNWGRYNYKTFQARDDWAAADLNGQLVKMQLQLSAEMAKNQLATAYSSYNTSMAELSSAQSYFKLIESGYKEGINSQIEFIDARSHLTNAQIALNINLFKVLEAMAGVERETATYQIQK